MKKEVMLLAWDLRRSGLAMNDALRKAWKEVKLQLLQQLLRDGIVVLTFRKVDGTVTTRIATRNSGFIPNELQPKGVHWNGQGLQAIPFFSLSDSAWRSFRTDSLLTFKAA